MNTDSVDYLEILSDLIRFDTTSRRSNLELIEYIQARLDSLQVPHQLTWNAERSKANLFATLGEDRGAGIVLSGHTDVVPVEGQVWCSDPFQPEIRDGRLYGRGSCDMKGFIAICLSRAKSIIEADLPVPVHFAFSYDEEVGCIGVRGLIDALKQRPVLPRACIIGEPTSMGVIRAHKGMLFKRCHVRGKSAHSSLVHEGVNAVTAAARTIARIDAIGERIRREGPFDEHFEPPYTTLHCGVIQGGTANNIIPNHCQFDFEIRNLPEQPTLPLFAEVEAYTRELEQRMQAVDESTGFKWQTIADYPGMNTSPEAPVIDLVSRLLGDHRMPGKVSYGTEGGHFQAADIPSVVCGPGSIEQAHKPDEFVELSQLARCAEFIDTLIGDLGQTPLK
jgi:acetylornithine deacetylase